MWGTAHLFLALEQHDHVAGQLAAHRQQRLERHQLREVLPLVVADAARVDAAAADRRLEGRD